MRGTPERRTKVKDSTKGALIALSVASLFAARGSLAADMDMKEMDAGKSDAKIKCAGVNECSGKGSCAGAGNECAGKNSCKGKGIVEMSAEECAKKGGKVVKS
jgi:hypothetical protein